MSDVQSYMDEATNEITAVKGSDDRGNVSARTSSRWYYMSRDKGSMYAWRVEYAAVKGGYVFYLENTSIETLVIKDIEAFADTACDFKISFVTVEDISGGITGSNALACNMNPRLLNVAGDKSRALKGGVSGITDPQIFKDIDVKAGEQGHYEFEGFLRLDIGYAIAIQCTEASNVIINVIGGFE
jgi:hypothetical protein